MFIYTFQFCFPNINHNFAFFVYFFQFQFRRFVPSLLIVRYLFTVDISHFMFLSTACNQFRAMHVYLESECIICLNASSNMFYWVEFYVYKNADEMGSERLRVLCMRNNNNTFDINEETTDETEPNIVYLEGSRSLCLVISDGR